LGLKLQHQLLVLLPKIRRHQLLLRTYRQMLIRLNRHLRSVRHDVDDRYVSHHLPRHDEERALRQLAWCMARVPFRVRS
jgi:hypothetical protein